MVEIHDLFKALDHTRTMVGSARLFHSLMNPSESIELIHAKQESLMEIEANDKLKNAIVDYLEIFRANEKDLFKVINAHMLPLLAYKDHKHAMKAVNTMLKAADAIPQPDTVYIDSLIKNILSFGGSPVSNLCRQPTYRTLYGIKARSEKSFFTPAWRFRPSQDQRRIDLAVPALYKWRAGLAQRLPGSGGGRIGYHSHLRRHLHRSALWRFWPNR